MLSRVLISFVTCTAIAGCAGIEKSPGGGAIQTSKALSASTLSSLDVPIEQIAAKPNGCAILDKDFPGLRQHPMYEYFKAMSLNQVAAMSKGQITPAMMAQAKIDIAALNPAANTDVPVVTAKAPTVATAH
jgi:hypothetical protein